MPGSKSTKKKSTDAVQSADLTRIDRTFSGAIPYINREGSWLEFNRRVLELAQEETLPLLERLKFLSITGSNLDEFVQVRVGGLHVLILNGHGGDVDPAGITVADQLKNIRKDITAFMGETYAALNQIEHLLSTHGVIRLRYEDPLSAVSAGHLNRVVNEELFPVLTPMPLNADDPPILKNLGLYMLIRTASESQPYWIMPLHAVRRFINLTEENRYTYMAVEDVIRHAVSAWFTNVEVLEMTPFRLTRNADFSVREHELPDLVVGMEEVLAKRQIGDPIRFEVDPCVRPETLTFLARTFGIAEAYIVAPDGPIDVAAFSAVAFMNGFEKLKDPPWEILTPVAFPPAEPIFNAVEKGDQLLIHPYESFEPVIRFVEEAANDPNVLAIKQILYRSGRVSRIVDALITAAERGKSVTVIVELKARFDEERNIDWAKKLERSGVQVIYGIRDYKTHAKICMVVRREKRGIVRYLHFGTGNYNAATARLYSDVGLFTCDPVFGMDAAAFFNTICGISTARMFSKLSMSPLTLRERVYTLIERAVEVAKSGQKARLTVKLNSLCDEAMVRKLYQASSAGVKIRLNIRGICTLRPQIKKFSENIRVISVVDRYLEHARIIRLEIGTEEEVFISSADWMSRNLDRRIELLIPLEDPACRKKATDFLETFFKDNVNAWQLQGNGAWKRIKSENRPAYRAQAENRQLLADAVRKGKNARRSNFTPHRRRTELTKS